jgi:hypothetical protein
MARPQKNTVTYSLRFAKREEDVEETYEMIYSATY